MRTKIWVALAMLMAVTGLSGCAAALVGAGVVVADEIVEDRQGGDGLF